MTCKFSQLQQNNKFHPMSYLPEHELIGNILSIAGLALAIPTPFFARHYSRTLYLCQFFYICSLIYRTTSDSAVGLYLDYSWLSFMPSFTKDWCNSPTDYLCLYGHLTSPAIVWAAVALLMLLALKLVAFKKPQVKFLTFYNAYKGLLHWFMGPMVYYATQNVVDGIKGQMGSNFIAGVVVLAIFVGIITAELIAFKMAQREEDNIWRKWVQLANHYMVIGFMVLALLSFASLQVLKYVINVPLALYAILYFVKYRFTYRILERVISSLQDAIIIAIFNIFVIKYEYISEYALDFYAVVIVAILEIIEVLLKIVKFIKRGNDDQEGPQIAPEKEGRGDLKDRNVNSFDDINPEGSYDNLHNNNNSNNNSGINNSSSHVNSPNRRGAAPRRR